MADHPEYRAVAATLFRQALAIPHADADAFTRHARTVLQPFNLCNLCDVNRRNMYPCVDSLHAKN
jgi:tetracycline 7-halogenase / FADH2 O2-dependent halogenase